MLPMREGGESLFCFKHDFVEKLFLNLIVYVDTNSNTTIKLFFKYNWRSTLVDKKIISGVFL